jgi:hypothetical protein
VSVFDLSYGKSFSGAGRCDADGDADGVTSPSSSLTPASAAAFLTRNSPIFLDSPRIRRD